jgi:5'-AMP-activated protein kinase regulatory beta subunit
MQINRHVSKQHTRRYNVKTTTSKPVEFFCQAPLAQAVFVAGTFNDWRPEATPLRRQTDGHWPTTLPLPYGHHEFKFIVDGQWCCEPGCEHEYRGCPKCCANEFGTMNRVLEVS